jgi:hypothetical protein
VPLRDVVLALLTVALRGVAFVATRLGLDHFSPPQLVALRLLGLACGLLGLAVIVLPVLRSRPV